MKSLVKAKEIIESSLDYWNGDRNDKAMKDALDNYECELDDAIDEISEYLYSSPLVDCWHYCDADGLPPCVNEFGGSGFSVNVLVTDKKTDWVDMVIFPHGLFGADTTPFFVEAKKKNREVVAWMYIPSLPRRVDNAEF